MARIALNLTIVIPNEFVRANFSQPITRQKCSITVPAETMKRAKINANCIDNEKKPRPSNIGKGNTLKIAIKPMEETNIKKV